MERGEKIITLKEIIIRSATLTSADAIELIQALCKSGKRIDLLKKNPPCMDDPGYLGWQALISVLCPSRMSVYGLMFTSEYERFERLSKWADKHVTEVNLFGQNPYEFNTNEGRFAYNAREVLSEIYSERWEKRDLESAGQSRLFER